MHVLESAIQAKEINHGKQSRASKAQTNNNIEWIWSDGDGFFLLLTSNWCQLSISDDRKCDAGAARFYLLLLQG